MVINLYAIRDLKMGKYFTPFQAINNEVAKRMLASSVNDKSKGNNLNEFAEDFQLYKVAEYNEETAEFLTINEFVANATEFKKEN